MVARRQSASVQSSLRDRDDGGMGVWGLFSLSPAPGGKLNPEQNG